MKEVSVSKTISFSDVVLSDRVPVAVIPYLLEHKELKSKVRLAFFGPVYHATFPHEGGPSVGVFVQFQGNSIQDIFCQCEASQEKGVCSHVAATIRAIFARSSEPIHSRFLRSPYYAILKHFTLTKKSPHVSDNKKEIRFSIGSQYIHVEGDIEPFLDMVEMEEENEDSSIKFAHLSEEELNSWYRGTPSAKLAFELSSLCDLARFLYLKEERDGKPVWHVQGHDRIVFAWDTLKVSIPYPKAVDPELFSCCLSYPGLHKVEPFHGCKEVICSYKQNTLSLSVEGTLLKDKKPIWSEDKGLFFREFPKKYSCVIEDKDEQARVLDTCFPEAKEQAVEWTCSLSSKGLRVTSKALGQECLAFVGRWAVTVQGEFIRTGGSFFQKGSFFVPKEELDHWLDHNRAFISLFPGFRVHDVPFLRDISYDVSSQGMLSFIRRAKGKEKSLLIFGSWTYVPEKGFFLKEMQQTSLPLDQPVLPHRVAEFIRTHKQKLSRIDGFFAGDSPIASVDLFVREEKGAVIYVEPKIVWKKPEYEKELCLFDEFGYVAHIGFFELPSSLSLAHEVHRAQTEEWNYFFEKELPLLRQREECRLDARLEKPQSLQLMCNQLEPEVVHESDMKADQLWNVDFFWKSANGRATFEEVISALERGEKWVITDAGTLFLSEVRFEWLLLLVPKKRKNKTVRSSIKTWDFLKIKAHDDLQFESSLDVGPRAIVEKLLHDTPIDPLPSLDLLNCSLRTYQMAGLEWLWMLYSFGLSGLLCDDMGVGKTHQAMALFAAVRRKMKENGVHRPFLVICPTSLIWHWKEKIASFLPSFKLFSYLGHDRTLEGFSQETHDLFLTTYGIWRNESAALQKISFEIALFDELQIAKNHCSRIWSALSQVSSHMRLGLTGTPIENQLRELKALFDLLVPGYLPEDSVFRELYVRPWEKQVLDKERFDSLSRYVRPFVLRRKKSEVLRDLPEKVEERYHVELMGEQKELYHQVAAQQAGMLIQQLRDESSPIPYIHIFALLSSLKQICNHPASYLKAVDQYEMYESGKWEAFCDLLDEAIESGQKVVVFSQFLAMLDIMKLYMTKKKIQFAEIRGRTKERGDEMRRFHKDPQCKVFLGSLQAAGLGIDLTAATVVIHYDRWWNAARENQATDRVHRIGQERGVQVCKLITLQTIEERIDRMIERKSQLLEDVISYDDHQVVKKLSRSELLELVQDLCT